MMRPLTGALGVLLVALILWDAFETVVLPRRVARRLRLTRLYFLVVWRTWAAVAGSLRNARRRESFLGLFGPLSLVLLLGTWAAGLVLGFALLQWGLGLRVAAPEAAPGFGTALYLSGSTLFTLGLGDIAPVSAPARAVTVVEAFVGFAFLALTIGYLPVIYQAFSRREGRIAMLDEWAGSPPTAGGLLARLGDLEDLASLERFFDEWEAWAADLLESHISYPVLAGFRSQHGNQSWLAGLTMILDACALVLSGVDGVRSGAAWRAFAMGRHVAVDLCQVLDSPPRPLQRDRLPTEDRERLSAMLRERGVSMRDDDVAVRRLGELRRMYEPYVNGLAGRLMVTLPPWLPAPGAKDNWQKTAWD